MMHRSARIKSRHSVRKLRSSGEKGLLPLRIDQLNLIARHHEVAPRSAGRRVRHRSHCCRATHVAGHANRVGVRCRHPHRRGRLVRVSGLGIDSDCGSGRHFSLRVRSSAIAAMIVVGTVERTRYVSAVMAVVACGAFVLQTMLLGQIFNLHGSPHPCCCGVCSPCRRLALAVRAPVRSGGPVARPSISRRWHSGGPASRGRR